MELISQSNNQGAASAARANTPSRIDHIRLLRAKVEASIRELEKSTNPDDACALKAKQLALKSYDRIICEMESKPQKDAKEITKLPATAMGLPLAESPADALDVARIAALLDMPECDFDRPRGSIRLAGERASIHITISDDKKPAVPS